MSVVWTKKVEMSKTLRAKITSNQIVLVFPFFQNLLLLSIRCNVIESEIG